MFNLYVYRILKMKSPTIYARKLLRQVFQPGELAGTSITGKKSNAHKEKEAKTQLDPIRVNTVISEYIYCFPFRQEYKCIYLVNRSEQLLWVSIFAIIFRALEVSINSFP